MMQKIILLVEDNPDDIALTLRALKKGKILNKIIVAKDGVEALDLLLGENPIFPALILLDLKLPKLDGFEVLKRLRANDRTKLLPVVILTSSKEQLDILNGYALGANSYIHKPVDFDHFIDAVQNLGLYWLVLNELPPIE